MFGSIQTTIIAMAIAVVIASVSTFGVTYKFVSSNYKQQIAAMEMASAKALQQATDKVLLAERKNNDITNKLNQEALERDKQISAAQAELDRYRVSNRRLQFSADSCATNRIADSATRLNLDGPSDAPTGVCVLPRIASETISYTFEQADRMRATLLSCQEYAKKVEQQRKEMSKPQ